MASMILVPLDDTVVFPTMDVTLPVDVGDEDRVLLIPRHDNAFAKVGTIAEVTDSVRLPGGGRAVQLSGVARGVAGAAHTDHAGRLRIEVTESTDDIPVDGRTRDLEREYRAVVEEILELRGVDERVGAWLRAIGEPGPLADTIGYAPDISFEDKVSVLETLDVTERLELAVRLQRERLTELQLRRKIREDVREGADKQQREYFLRKQMESIQRELGEDSGSVVEEYRTKIAEAGMPEAVEEQATKELGRLERMGEQSGEASMIRSYLDWLIAVPWKERSDEVLDPVHAREILDTDHAGLEDVKDRIVEYLAVKKLRVERGITEDKRSGAILTLIGPPGTGKTSIGESIARATGREFVRMSPRRRPRRGRDPRPPPHLHRRAPGPPGARAARRWDHEPGDHARRGRQGRRRLARRPQRGPARGARPGPEPLVPRPLPRRRARPLRGHVHRHRQRGGDHPRPAAGPHGGHPLRRLHGGREDRDRARLPVAAPARAQRPARGRGHDRDELLQTVVSEYTREAGVRNLERELGTVLRKTATKIASGKAEAPVAIDLDAVRDALGRQKVFQEAALRTAVPGVATGLAVTGTGGDVLFIEATSMEGKDGLVLTGQLGDVMKESARIALSYVRGHADELGIDPATFHDREFHVHVPAGAIPKDGPSAGITMTTALASLLSGRPVKHTVGMTGEVTLQGRVLPIGGLKQKVLAAHAAGLTDVILPERNRGDLDDVPEDVREQMTFHPVMSIDEVLDIALEPARTEAVA